MKRWGLLAAIALGLGVLPACGPTRGADVVVHGGPPLQSIDVSGWADVSSG